MKLAFVAPWYGPEIAGGAESEVRRTAEHLAAAGLAVEVLTTCAREFRADWGQNYHRPGRSIVRGVPVHRFRVDRRQRDRFDRVARKLMAGRAVAPDEERVYFQESVNSRALVDHVAARRDEQTFIFIPYPFGTTYAGVMACAGRALMIPCLHDEPYARLSPVNEMMQAVRRLIFHSPAEMRLASRLYDLAPEVPVLLGEGVDSGLSGSGAAFRRKYGLADPFVLYVGRRDAGKNAGMLLSYYRRYRERREAAPALVLLGGDERWHEPASGIHDLGFVPAQDRQDAFAAADVLCQPSQAESFSLVLMEGWCAGVPALVYGGCAVTREHCQRGQGGLYFGSYPEFEACLDLLLASPELRGRLGRNGRTYVLANYTWDRITARYLTLLGELDAT